MQCIDIFRVLNNNNNNNNTNPHETKALYAVKIKNESKMKKFHKYKMQEMYN